MFNKSRKKKLFTFSKGNRTVLPKERQRSQRAQKIVDQKDLPPWYIRGIKAGSKEEYWCSIVLAEIEEQTGWGWEFQVPVFGGRDRAGGNVVDFLIYTPGMWTMLDPKGRYWHTGIHEDQDQMRNVARRKKWNLIEWFTDETPTLEIMRQFLRDKLNV